MTFKEALHEIADMREASTNPAVRFALQDALDILTEVTE